MMLRSAFSPGGGPQVITKVKAADETVNNSTTFQNDNDLFFSIGANEVWKFVILGTCVSSAVADIKVQFTAPVGISGFIREKWNDGNPYPWSAQNWINPSGSGNEENFLFEGVAINGANSGTVQLQWAQNTAEVSDTIVKAGTNLIATRLA